MSKKILFLLIIVVIFILSYIGFYLYQTSQSEMLKSIKEHNDINILFMLKDYSNKENTKLKFLVAKYNLVDKYIKICFVDENITILQKSIKSRTLKEMVLSVKESEQINFTKSEIEKLLDNKINIDYYICLDAKNFKSIVKLFSEKKHLENNFILSNICLNEDVDRINTLISSIKLINYIRLHSGILDYIRFVKNLDNNNILLETNFTSKDIFFLCKYFCNRDKYIRYADIPTLNKRKRIEIDETIEQIIEFLKENNETKEKELKLKVLNATNKDRLAVKASNKLRKNKFDVIEWGSSSQKYDWTMVFDLINDYKRTKKITDVLNCGEVIFVPKNSLITEAIVYLGQDCSIYDKLDRNKKR